MGKEPERFTLDPIHQMPGHRKPRKPGEKAEKRRQNNRHAYPLIGRHLGNPRDTAKMLILTICLQRPR
jgi:hypothetical protein